jgi:Caspase domain
MWTRLVFAVVALACLGLSSVATLGAAEPLAPLDPAVLGSWEIGVPNAQGIARWFLDIRPDGTYAFHAEGPAAPPPHQGSVSFADGRWRLLATTGYRDGGTYKMADADTLVATGILGTGVWRRNGPAPVSAATAPGPVALPSPPPDTAEAALPTPPERTTSPGGAAGLGRRVALLIGNSGYTAVPALDNSRRDAEAVAAALTGIGFAVVKLGEDVGREKFLDLLRSFAGEADGADWAIVYYAGHGIEIGGVNYLIPVDARLESDRDVALEAISLDQVMAALGGAGKLRVVILDACRNNPFAARMKRTDAARSVGRGLARVEPNTGTLVVYSAKDGEIALDGDSGKDSPFVAALVRRLPTPGMEINKLFRVVHDDVVKETGGRQEPFVYGALPGEDFFFAGK